MATNGKIPVSTLTKLSTPGYLVSSAAASFERLKKAAKVTGTEHEDEAYRDYADQVRLFTTNYQKTRTEYLPGKVDRRVWNGVPWYRKKGKAAASVPGTSTHGFGVAVDWQNLGLPSGAKWKAFAKLAKEHGWSNAIGAANDEPWHWDYNITEDKHREDDNMAKDPIQLTDEFPLSTWAKTQFGTSETHMSVQRALGYQAAGAYTTANAQAKMLEESVKQTELLTEIRDLLKKGQTVNVTIPGFDITLSGKADPK